MVHVNLADKSDYTTETDKYGLTKITDKDGNVIYYSTESRSKEEIAKAHKEISEFIVNGRADIRKIMTDGTYSHMRFLQEWNKLRDLTIVEKYYAIKKTNLGFRENSYIKDELSRVENVTYKQLIDEIAKGIFDEEDFQMEKMRLRFEYPEKSEDELREVFKESL